MTRDRLWWPEPGRKQALGFGKWTNGRFGKNVFVLIFEAFSKW